MELVIETLRRKRAEIQGAIKKHEASIAQVKHDLAHVAATIRMLECPGNGRAYIVSQGFFAKGEIAAICQHHLADGEMNTRELAERVMAEKGLDGPILRCATRSSTRWCRHSGTPLDGARSGWSRSERAFACGGWLHRASADQISNHPDTIHGVGHILRKLRGRGGISRGVAYAGFNSAGLGTGLDPLLNSIA